MDKNALKGQLKDMTLESVIMTALTLPGVKVKRNTFLADIFKDKGNLLSDIISTSPAKAGISREELSDITKKLITKRAGISSAASFAAGLPGGFTAAAALPADVLQFFGTTIRLAQEIAYLYGADDIRTDGELDDEKVKNQLILYIGAMYGVESARAGVRILSAMNDRTGFTLPDSNKMLRLWMPMLSRIGAVTEVKIFRAFLTRGVSKVIPVAGGLISGGMNYASLMPMAKRLQADLDSACFDYSADDLEDDLKKLEKIGDEREASFFNTVKAQAETYADMIEQKLNEMRQNKNQY